MKFSLDYRLNVNGVAVNSRELALNPAMLTTAATHLLELEGALILLLDGKELPGADYAEPLVRLLAQWLRRVPWMLSGDPEVIPLRNSEQCYSFIPASGNVEFSFFNGTETEIDEYIIEPLHIRLEVLLPSLISLGEKFYKLLEQAFNATILNDEDGRDLRDSLQEAQRAWHDHQLHGRR